MSASTPMSVYLTTAVASYLLGTIPFGYILVRLWRGEDVRSSGSGNIGATNVARMSPALGVATLVLDASKGLAAVLLARALSGGEHQRLVMTVAAFSAILGHLFPVWLKFRGGKGVATGLGSFLLIAPKAVLLAASVFVVLVLIFRYISLGSIIAVASFPIFAWTMHECENVSTSVFLALASLLIIAKHHENIRRLLTHREPRFQRRGR